MNSITKHLPLLALVLLVSSTELRAEESVFPFKKGDAVDVYLERGLITTILVQDIKGKWVKNADGKWFNSDLFLYVTVIEVPNKDAR